jgi:NAD-dependent SIR2 family protein deacetylase
MEDPGDAHRRAAEAIAAADALLVTAGAGMGVDSGLPDFRGDEGFWRAYPPFRHLGLSFVDLADPRWFDDDPALAWGFYGHRLHLYRDTAPHRGYARLRRWSEARAAGGFVFTSNVDGHFQRAGFAEERVCECHGAIGRLQCTAGCGREPWAADGASVTVDPATMRATDPLPACPGCGALARPGILMFGDLDWDPSRTAAQQARLRAWLSGLDLRRLVVVECGAGTAVPTVRMLGQDLARRGATLIRVNPREPQAPAGAIAIPQGAAPALAAIDATLA